MKKMLYLAIALAITLTSCNMMEGVFDWSDDGEEEEFSSYDWSTIQRNVFIVESTKRGHEMDPTPLTFPENGEICLFPNYSTNKVSMMITTYKTVDLQGKPVDDAFYIVLVIEDVPFSMSKDGVLKFSKKTYKGVLNYGHSYGDLLGFYKKQGDCKVSITGDLAQEGANESIRNGVPLKGNVSIKIISPEGEHFLLGCKELETEIVDGINSFYL